MSPLRSDISPTRLLQANDSNHSAYQEFGKTDCHFRRRHSHLTSPSQSSTIYLQEYDPSRAFGIPHQCEQMFATPFPATYLPGNNAQHCHIVPVLAEREAGSHSTGSTSATYQRQRYTIGVSFTPGTHEPCSSEWHFAGPSALSSTSEVHLSGIQRSGCKHWRQSLDLSTPQINNLSIWSSTLMHRFRARGQQQTTPLFEIVGAHRSLSRLSHVIGDQPQLLLTCAATTPQQWSISTRGGHTLAFPVCDSAGTLFSCAQVRILGGIETYCRYTQCQCRHNFSLIQLQGGMDIGHPHISKDSVSALSYGGGSLCVQAIHQVDRYVSRYPDPATIAFDAFLQDWRKWKSSYTLLWTFFFE